MNYFNYHPKHSIREDFDPTFKSMIQYFLSVTLIFVIYYALRIEIGIYFSQLYSDSIGLPYSGENSNLASIRDEDILNFKIIWILIYSMVFFLLITLGSIVKIKNEQIGQLNLIANGLVLFIFLLHGLFVLSELRESYINPQYPEKFPADLGNILVRYLAFFVFSSLLIINYWLITRKFMVYSFKIFVDLFASLAVLWILSSELLQWLDLGGYRSSYKLGLSILWGSYSLLLIIIGIWKKLKYLRISAIVLFGITLIKLSAYDISGMDTISKTIVFILLGVLLLIISFLYNKYRKIIF